MIPLFFLIGSKIATESSAKKQDSTKDRFLHVMLLSGLKLFRFKVVLSQIDMLQYPV